MSIVAKLREKPWESDQIHGDQHASREHTQKSGLKVLLVVISVLFFLFIIAFLMRSQYPDWQPLAEQASHPLFDQSQLWLNTIYLVIASIFIQIAKICSSALSSLYFRFSILAAGMFSAAFVAGQLLFWQQLNQQGFFVNTNPALSFFYLFTGLHMAHVAVGIGTWLMAVFFIARSLSTQADKIKHYVGLCAMYWHFLLGLWALLFVLLVSKPETYNAIVEFCGLGVQ